MDKALSRLEIVTQKLENLYTRQTPNNGASLASSRKGSFENLSEKTSGRPSVGKHKQQQLEEQQRALASTSDQRSILDLQFSDSPQYQKVLEAYKSSIATHLDKIIKNSKIMGGQVSDVSSELETCFQVMLQMIKASEQCKQPDPATTKDAIGPIVKTVETAEKLGKDRKNIYYVNCLVIYEAVQSFNWLFYSPKQAQMDRPENFVQQCWSSAEFQNNKIMRQNKNSNQFQYEWAASLKELFKSFQVFISQNFPDGLVWNPQGQDLATSLKSLSPEDQGSPFDEPSQVGTPQKANELRHEYSLIDMEATDVAKVDSDPNTSNEQTEPKSDQQKQAQQEGTLNQNLLDVNTPQGQVTGTQQEQEGIVDLQKQAEQDPSGDNNNLVDMNTPRDEAQQRQQAGAMASMLGKLQSTRATLKQVSKDMTKKKVQPDQPDQQVGLTSQQQQEGAKPLQKQLSKKAPLGEPRCEVVDGGRRCIVENFINNPDISVESTGNNMLVMIINCQKSVVNIHGKVNVVTVESCKNFGCVMEDVIACCEVTRSSDIKLQAVGKIPTIQIELTNICNLYLTEKSLNVEVITSQSSTINVCVPTDDDDFKEMMIPQQFKTVLQNGALITEAVKHAGE